MKRFSRRNVGQFVNLPVAVVLVVAAGAALTALRAQDSSGAGTVIRSETREVLVDAVAIDKKGKFNRDLTEKDFRIWEDGKEQKIGAFSLESAGLSPERPSKHYIAMLFDTSAGQASQMTMRQEAVRFVDGFASPDRYMAVINYNFDGGLRIGQNFTIDRDLLKKALSQVPSSNAAPTATAAPAGRGGRGGGLQAGSNDSFAQRNMLASLRNLVNSLATIRGRKALVFFSGGMSASPELIPDLKATIDACNKANVAVYTVGAGLGGNTAGVNNASSAATPPRNARATVATELGSDNQNVSNSLADGTGGMAFFTTNDLADSLGKVAREQDEYYLLSYTPTIDSAEGTCHELRVKVDKSDLDVRARKGYCTSKPVDVLAGKPIGKDLEARAASDAPATITARMQLPWFYSGPNVARVNLAMDIVPSAVKVQKEKGKFHGEFDLAGVAYKPDGTIAARVSDSVKLEFENQQQVDAFLSAPYHYENQFEIAPGQYDFRMAFSSGAQGFGKVSMPLKIEPWNGQTLSESGLALSHNTHRAADLASGLDDSLLEGLRPLVARGTEVVPTGTNQFRSNENAFFYVEAYEPLLSSATAAALPAIGLRFRILDRATGQPKEDTGVKMATTFLRAGNPVVPFVFSLPVANLKTGAYKLEVSVMRSTGDPVIRTADFDIQ